MTILNAIAKANPMTTEEIQSKPERGYGVRAHGQTI